MKNPLANVIQIFAKSVSLFKRKLYILWKLLISFWKENQNFEDVLASQTCVFGKSGLGFNPKANKVAAQNLFQLSLKNNRLKSRNNRLFVVSTAWKRDTLLGSAESESFLFLRVFWNAFLRSLIVLWNTLTTMDPNSQGGQI